MPSDRVEVRTRLPRCNRIGWNINLLLFSVNVTMAYQMSVKLLGLILCLENFEEKF